MRLQTKSSDIGEPLIIVTGIAGFIGGRFAQLAAKEEKILGLDISDFANESGILYRKVDLRNPESIYSIASENDVTSIVHCAAMISPEKCLLEPRLAYETNIIGTLNMLDFARKRDIKKFIYISTGGVYRNSDPEDIVTEDWPVEPSDIYDISKVASENTVSYYAKDYGLDAAAIRITAPYGPGMYRPSRNAEIPDGLNRHVLIFALKCARREDIYMPYGGDHTVNYTYVDDIAHGISLAIKAKLGGFEALNLTGGKNYKISDVGKAILEVCPDLRVQIGSGDLLHSSEEADPTLKPLSIQQGRFDISKAGKLIGYVPRFSLVEGLRELVSSVRESLST